MSAQRPCPLCGRPLYGWIALPTGPAAPGVGVPVDAPDAGERVLERCESCGVAVRSGCDVDLLAEWEAICRPGGDAARAVAIPNRASLQASLGGEGWAALGEAAGNLVLTPRSLELLAERNGHRLVSIRQPRLGRSQGWMWQTLLNGLTFHLNFAREARAGRLRPANGRGRLAFAADLVVTVLAGPLVALVSFPLELTAALARHGGQIEATTTPAR